MNSTSNEPNKHQKDEDCSSQSKSPAQPRPFQSQLEFSANKKNSAKKRPPQIRYEIKIELIQMNFEITETSVFKLQLNEPE